MGLPCSKVDITLDDAVQLEVAFRTNDLHKAGIRIVDLVDQRSKLTKASKAKVDEWAKRYVVATAPAPPNPPELERQ
jgi:hypothetical protein